MSYQTDIWKIIKGYDKNKEGIKIQKVEKLVIDLYVKNEYVIHMRNLKQALNYGLTLKKVYRVITFNQKTLYWNEYWTKTKSKK